MKFIEVHMYVEQRKGSSYGNRTASASMTYDIPFKDWKVGYIVKGKGGEQFTIRQIDSTDGVMRYQDCTVSLENAAGESRVLKGATLQSGYDFVSKGDVVETKADPAERSDVKPISIAIDGIREFYARKAGEGTRILLKDKTAYAVLENYDDVKHAIKAAHAS